MRHAPEQHGEEPEDERDGERLAQDVERGGDDVPDVRVRERCPGLERVLDLLPVDERGVWFGVLGRRAARRGGLRDVDCFRAWLSSPRTGGAACTN